MIGYLFIDTGPLGHLIANVANYSASSSLIRETRAEGRKLVVPAIVDYELRRELIRLKSRQSLDRLDEMIERSAFDPIDSKHLRLAAEIWARARNVNRGAAPPEDIDGDAILAAQVCLLPRSKVLTGNAKHLKHYGCDVREWVRPRA